MLVLFAVIGVLKCECVVYPLGIIVAATPDIVFARAIIFLARKWESKAWYKYVFSVSRGPLMKNNNTCFMLDPI
ncbi:hypothetical protein LguiA_022363 [Lonicera macranthoides]